LQFDGAEIRNHKIIKIKSGASYFYGYARLCRCGCLDALVKAGCDMCWRCYSSRLNQREKEDNENSKESCGKKYAIKPEELKDPSTRKNLKNPRAGLPY
jgi:hypothetical protein